MLTDVGKGYRTMNGAKIGTGFAVQVNRDGWKRAVRNEGKYTLLALSEFHEIERSSTYVVFVYSDSYMMQVNEMKVQMQKHRIGSVMQEPVVTYVYPECSVVGEAYSANTVKDNNFDDMMDDLLDGDDLGEF